MYVSYGVLGFSIFWGVASVITIGLQCSPNRWALGPSGNDKCIDQRIMQIVIRVLDVVSDFAIILLPIFMMQKVQTSWKNKLLVIGLFGIRIW